MSRHFRRMEAWSLLAAGLKKAMEVGVRSLKAGPLNDDPTAHHTILEVLQMSLGDMADRVVRAVIENMKGMRGASDWVSKWQGTGNTMEARSPDGKRVLTVMVITPWQWGLVLPTEIQDILMMTEYPAKCWELQWLEQYIEPLVKKGIRFGGCTAQFKPWFYFRCSLSFRQCIE